jgi:anti-sigma factor RsiW
MNEHVHTWLQAYHDGELKGTRLRKVEEHLESCAACRAELEQMQSLSALLQGSSLPEFTPGDRFVAQVALRLPRKAPETGWQHTLRLGWQMIPFGLVGTWAFAQAAFLMVTILALVDQFCTVCREYLAWLSFSNSTIWWALGLNLLVTVLLGLLSSSWLAGWWVSRQHAQVSPQKGLSHSA